MTTLFKRALRSGWLRVGALVLSALAIGLPIAASASSSTASESKDTAAFRKEFVSYLTQMQQVGAMLQSSPRGRAALTRLSVKPSTLARSRDAVQQMTPAELVVLQKAFASVPGWQTHPRDLKAALRRNGFSPNGPVRAFAVGPDCDPGPGSPLGITDWYIAVGVALALEIVHEAIPDDIITSIAQVAAAGLWGIAATAALALESVNGVESECNDAKLEDFTRTQLDVAVSTRATQTSVNAFTATLNSLSTLVNQRLDVAVSTRATQTSVDAFTATLNNLSTPGQPATRRRGLDPGNSIEPDYVPQRVHVQRDGRQYEAGRDHLLADLGARKDRQPHDHGRRPGQARTAPADRGRPLRAGQPPGRALRGPRLWGRLPRSHSRDRRRHHREDAGRGAGSRQCASVPCRRRCRPRSAGLQGCVRRLRQGVSRRGNLGSRASRYGLGRPRRAASPLSLPMCGLAQQPGSRKLAIRVCQPLPSGADAAPATV